MISNPIKTLSVVFVSSWRFSAAFFLDESFLSGEESLPDHGELRLKDLMKTVFESVWAHNASIVGKKNDSAAPATVLHVQEVVLDHGEGAVVLARRLPQHDVVVLTLALVKDALDQADLVLTHLKL